MNAPISSHGQETAAPANGNGDAAREHPSTSLATLIQDAEALHATSADTRASVARLIAGLRRHRKPSRLVSERDAELTQTAPADRSGRRRNPNDNQRFVRFGAGTAVVVRFVSASWRVCFVRFLRFGNGLAPPSSSFSWVKQPGGALSGRS